MKKSTTLKQLNFLIGKWHTSGKLLTGKGDAASSIRGMDKYEWIANGNFILHTVDVFIGKNRTEVTEIIGTNRSNFFMTSYDNTGAVTTMKAALTGKGVLKLRDKKMRASLSRNSDGSMTAHWELYDKIWTPWMEIELRK